MDSMPFKTAQGAPVPAVTEAQIREVDRIAVESFHLSILQMMENAGRSLAQQAMDMLAGVKGEVTLLAGSGGNGGGGLCCARHLHNRGLVVHLILTRPPSSLQGAPLAQWKTLQQAGLKPSEPTHTEEFLRRSALVVDGLIGYSLKGAPRGLTADLIRACNQHARQVISLDLPSGMNATTGAAPGETVRADRILTLALPKTGLQHFGGPLFLADLGIPPEVYHPLGVVFEPFFGPAHCVRLSRT